MVVVVVVVMGIPIEDRGGLDRNHLDVTVLLLRVEWLAVRIMRRAIVGMIERGLDVGRGMCMRRRQRAW